MVFCGRVHKEDIEVHFEIPIKGNHFSTYNILAFDGTNEFSYKPIFL